MRKGFLILALIALFTSVRSAQYWAGTGGNDSYTGTQAQPWLTMTKIASATLDGDTVNIVGLVTGTAAAYPKNIKLFGIDTVQSIISLTVTDQLYSLYFWSGDFSNSQIEIKNIKFVGGSTAAGGLYIWKKTNCYVHHCSFSGFVTRGIAFANTTIEPIPYAFGLRFEYNVIYNCATSSGNTTSNVSLIGQQNYTYLYNINKNGKRGATMPGALLKFNYTIGGNVGYSTFEVQGNDDNVSWSFALEFWNSGGGDVVHHNVIRGILDMVGGTFTPGVYTYQLHIHHNDIGFTSFQNTLRLAILIEGSSKYVLIENNSITYVTAGIMIYTNSAHASRDITIRRNLITVGSSISGYCYGIRHYGTTTGFTMTNYSLYNNTIVGLPGSVSETTSGVSLPYGGTTNNFSMRNDIITGFVSSPVRTVAGTGSINNLTIAYCQFFNNGNSNALNTAGGIVPTGLVSTNNQTTNPLLNANYTLQSGSPCIDTGVDTYLEWYNLPDRGAFEYIPEQSSDKEYLNSSGNYFIYNGKILAR